MITRAAREPRASQSAYFLMLIHVVIAFGVITKLIFVSLSNILSIRLVDQLWRQFLARWRYSDKRNVRDHQHLNRQEPQDELAFQRHSLRLAYQTPHYAAP
jgi:hypothetical protein